MLRTILHRSRRLTHLLTRRQRGDGVEGLGIFRYLFVLDSAARSRCGVRFGIFRALVFPDGPLVSPTTLWSCPWGGFRE